MSPEKVAKAVSELNELAATLSESQFYINELKQADDFRNAVIAAARFGDTLYKVMKYQERHRSK